MIEIPKSLALKGVDVARSSLAKEFGYDFFGLAIKLVVYFIVAWFLDGYFKAVAGQQNIVGKIIGIIGGVGGAFAYGKLLDFFTKPEDQKVPYWTIVKTLAVFLVFLEAKNYYELNESNGVKPSPVTLGVFASIIGFLTFITFPDVMSSLKIGSLLGKVSK